MNLRWPEGSPTWRVWPYKIEGTSLNLQFSPHALSPVKCLFQLRMTFNPGFHSQISNSTISGLLLARCTIMSVTFEQAHCPIASMLWEPRIEMGKKEHASHFPLWGEHAPYFFYVQKWTKSMCEGIKLMYRWMELIYKI